jgi:Fur family ferric uptake transcriptional regulator
MANAGDWTSETLSALKREGFRNGGARHAVITLLGQEGCCLSAQEIFDRLRAGGSTVGLASVYRVLDLLLERQLVQRIDIGDGVMRFEQAHDGREHHHHLVCSDCGKVEAFADERLERALRAVEKDSGYASAAHDVLLRGECGDCRSA